MDESNVAMNIPRVVLDRTVHLYRSPPGPGGVVDEVAGGDSTLTGPRITVS